MKNQIILLSGFLLISNLQFKAQKITYCKSENYSLNDNNDFYKNELIQYVKNNNLPGAIMAIKTAEKPLWIGAEGKKNLENDNEMEVCTPFRIGSITKVFIAAVALKLQEEKKINLDNKITQYLPELKIQIPQANSITLRMLLNHSSGIIDPKNDDSEYLDFITNFPDKVDSMTVDDRLKKYVYGKSLQFSPGTASHYSNSGYWLIGKIIERVSKKSMQALLAEKIFGPLKMNDSYYDERLNPKVSQGYHLMEGNLINVTKWDKADGDGDPSSGIVSTAENLFKFGESLFSGKIINKKSVQEMLQTLKLSNCLDKECDYGLGIENWNIGNLKGYGKNGSSVGYEANWIYLPSEKTSIITFTNKGGGTDKNFIERIIKK